MENFRNVYREFTANGYAPKIKGMIWMQGEADLEQPILYKDVLKHFINDVREDLSEITGDMSLSTMPFVIGKIATSFYQWDNPLVPAFNQMQERVSQEDPACATVETSDLIINREDGTLNGSDRWHFNCRDMETLGMRFGNKLLEMNDENN